MSERDWRIASEDLIISGEYQNKAGTQGEPPSARIELHRIRLWSAEDLEGALAFLPRELFDAAIRLVDGGGQATTLDLHGWTFTLLWSSRR